jgi:hypothetical protein
MTEKIYIEIDPTTTFENVVVNDEPIRKLLKTVAKQLPSYSSSVIDMINDECQISFTADKTSIEIETTKPEVFQLIVDISTIINGKQGKAKKEKYFRHLKFEDLPEREKPRKIAEMVKREYENRMWTLSLVGLNPQMRVDTIDDVISTFIDSYPEEFRDTIIGCREEVLK